MTKPVRISRKIYIKSDTKIKNKPQIQKLQVKKP